jgi:hypothetical protein
MHRGEGYWETMILQTMARPGRDLKIQADDSAIALKELQQPAGEFIS